MACGGLELNVLRIGEWLQSAGYPIVIFGEENSEVARRAAMAGLPFQHIFSKLKLLRPFAFLRLKLLVRRLKLRILVINTTRDITRAVMAKVLGGNRLKLLYLQHMQIGVDKKDLYHTWQYLHLDAWISPLPFLSRQVSTKTRMPRARVHEIPFGINLESFIEEKPEKAAARDLLGLPQNSIVAGVIGRLDPQKNQALLLHAAAPIIHAGVDLQILIVGTDTLDDDMQYGRELRELVLRLGISASVHFRPFRDDINMAYAALDIFTLTSQSESFGMVTIEAMAAGLPVIATRSGGTPELVDELSTGFLVDPADPTELETALRLLVEVPELRNNFGRAGRRKVIEKYSHLTQISDLGDVVKKIA